jgi:hypothetical protein
VGPFFAGEMDRQGSKKTGPLNGTRADGTDFLHELLMGNHILPQCFVKAGLPPFTSSAEVF